jgi:hypothetical protein
MLINSCSERRQVAKLIARGAQEGELCCGQRILDRFGSLTSGDATSVWLSYAQGKMAPTTQILKRRLQMKLASSTKEDHHQTLMAFAK